MKTNLALAVCASLLLSTAAIAAQSDDGQPSVKTVKTVTTTTTVQHVNGNHEAWYRQGGVLPTEYRDNRYVVQHVESVHLNEPPQGSHWVRGDNGDFLLVNDMTGVISNIVQNPPMH